MPEEEVEKNGFSIIPGIYSDVEIESLVKAISKAKTTKETFRKTRDVFAIRQFLLELPETVDLIFNQKLLKVTANLFESGYVPVKSIYFDKPGDSNWFVAFHQDLTISVAQRFEMKGFGPWTVKQNQFSVQPPVEILEDNFTVRIHLDDTDEDNGALRVIPGSHLNGVTRFESLNITKEEEITCSVPKGGIMIMKPLLMHASGKSRSNRNRRVIHIEFSRKELPDPLVWSERLMTVLKSE